MSFILTVYVHEGILMTSQRALSSRLLAPAGIRAWLKRFSKPSTHLLFNRVGVSVCAPMPGARPPMPQYVQSLFTPRGGMRVLQVDDIAWALFQHFSEMERPPGLVFHVAGYDKTSQPPEQHVWLIDIARSLVKRLNSEGAPGIAWGGSDEMLARENLSLRDLDDVLVIRPDRVNWLDRATMRQSMAGAERGRQPAPVTSFADNIVGQDCAGAGRLVELLLSNLGAA